MLKHTNWKTFWYTNLFSILTLIVGIILAIKPTILQSICQIFGGLLCLAGVVSLVLYFLPKTRSSEHLFYGIALLIIGILLGLLPGFLNFMIPLLFGGWVLISSLSGMYRNWNFRKNVPHWWVGFLLCGISALLGIFILTRIPFFVPKTIQLIGIICIIHAVFRLVSALLGRKGYQKQAEQDVIETTIQE